MKATGVVRKMDNLGRIVIPKEIRRTLRIREGDPLEIFTGNEGEIVFKKYSPISDISIFAKQYAKSLAKTTGKTVCITDKDTVVSVSGSGRRELDAKPISKQLEELIEKRENIIAAKGDKNFVNITKEGNEPFTYQVINIIICEGDAIGAVVILTKEQGQNMGELEMKLAGSAAGFLGKQIEN